MKHLKFCFFLIFLICSSFQLNVFAQTALNDITPDNKNLNVEQLESAIKSELSIYNYLPGPKSSFIKKYYEASLFKPIWIPIPANTLKIDTLLSFISHISVHGIKPDQLGYRDISKFRNDLIKGNMSYLQLAKLDLFVSTIYIQYCSGIKYGFINPGIFEAYHKSIQKADSAFIWNCFNAQKTHLLNYLSRIQPKSKAYLSLQAEKDNYNFFIDSIFTPISLLSDKQTIKFGTYHSSLPLIARRLMITGELPFDPAYQTSYQSFNYKLLKAINLFREKTGLMIDQEIGNSTIDALNMTFTEYITKIDVNLERLRWVPLTSLGKKYIRVNVADMTLKAFKDDTIALNMKVCVGRPKNMTPLLQSKIFELVINPTWTVPNSIIINEIAKIASKSTSYFERNHIRVYLQGSEIDPSTVDWTKINSNHQPYKLVQDSGNANSLGRIKFNFKNPFSVYLHDTNSKGTFKHHDRAVSHGCVRVERPLELVNFCFPDLNPIYKTQIQKNDLLKDKIRHSIDLNVISKSGKEMLKSNPKQMRIKRVVLNPYIPIVMDYQTCFISTKGEILFRDDIYHLDSLLNKQLKDIRQKL